eukprot:s7701_g3.t1
MSSADRNASSLWLALSQLASNLESHKSEMLEAFTDVRYRLNNCQYIAYRLQDQVSMLNARVDELLFRIRLLEEVPDVTDAASAVSDLKRWTDAYQCVPGTEVKQTCTSPVEATQSNENGQIPAEAAPDASQFCRAA